MKINKNQNKTNIRWLIVVVTLSVCAILWRINNGEKTQKTTRPAETINLSVATEDEKQSSEDNKQNLPDNTPDPNPAPGPKQVTVTITSLDANPVRARVDGVVEDSTANCTTTFTKGTDSFSVASASVANVSHTLCAARPGRILSSGQWSIVVSYKSNRAEGTSAPSVISVQ